MRKYRKFLLAVTALGFCAIPFTGAHAGGPAKVDRILQKAIEDTAAVPPVVMPEPAPAPEPEFFAMPEPAPAAEPPPPNGRPLGSMLGRMLFLPSLTLEQRYDDNIQASNNNEIDDFITVVNPALRAELVGSEHALAVDIAYETRQFWDRSDETVHNYSGNVEGHIHGGVVQLPYKLRYSRDHEERTEDLTRQLPEEPIGTEEFLAEGGARFKVGQAGLLALGRYIKEEFDDGRTPGGAAVVRRDADRETWEGEGRLSYDFLPSQSFSLGGLYGRRDYERRNFQGGGFNDPSRDSKHVAAWAGWEMDYRGLVFGDLRLGYESRDYDAAALSDIDNLLARADMGWNIKPATTLKLGFNHSHYEDDEVVNPILRTLVSAAIEQKLWDEVVVGLGGEWDRRDFEGSAREDETLLIRAIVEYLISPRFSLAGEYNFSTRDSTQGAFDYDRNVWLMRLTGRL